MIGGLIQFDKIMHYKEIALKNNIELEAIIRSYYLSSRTQKIFWCLNPFDEHARDYYVAQRVLECRGDKNEI